MKPITKNLASPPASGEARLAELVDAIRAGDHGAVKELHRILGPGVRFLLQQRVSDSTVDVLARSVLEAAVRTIREESVASGSVVRMVRQLIVRRFPARLRESREARRGSGIKTAERILRGMSSVEQDALRRCYVLGEAPESFLQDLKLTRDQFQTLQYRARAEFSSKRPPTANVA
jgi:hypothetical protein